MHVMVCTAVNIDDPGGHGGMQGGMGVVLGVGGMSPGIAQHSHLEDFALMGSGYLPHEQELGFIEALLVCMMQHLPNGPLQPAPNPRP